MLPPDLHAKWGHLPFLKQRGKSEWSAACPICGSLGHEGNEWPDRARIFGAGDRSRLWCRKCNHLEWLNDAYRPGKEDIDRFRENQIQIEERRKREAETALSLLRTERLWERYHLAMPDEARQWWRSQGVPDFWQDYLRLGYCPDKTIWHNAREHHTPSYTIPVFDVGWVPVNLRHRLIHPPVPKDKYRPDRAGLSASIYLTNPDLPIAPSVLAVEGEKKAIVCAALLDVNPEKCSVVGFPGATPGEGVLSRLERAERILLIPDPDADWSAIAARYGKRAKIVDVAKKIDDAIVAGDIDRAGLRGLLKRAIR